MKGIETGRRREYSARGMVYIEMENVKKSPERAPLRYGIPDKKGERERDETGVRRFLPLYGRSEYGKIGRHGGY